MNDSTIELINYYKDSQSINTLRKILLEYAKSGLSINEVYGGYALLHIIQPFQNVKLLLDRGADPNVSGIFNIKPIHLYYDYDCIKLLVERGARPCPYDNYNLNPLFWQKDYKSIIYLLNYCDLYNSIIIPDSVAKKYYSPYYKMLVEGGYDPFSENNISTSPALLQRDKSTFSVILSSVFSDYDNFGQILYDVVYENILFKPCITKKIISPLKYYLSKDNLKTLINHQNVVGNTPLHVQYNLENIKELLKLDANTSIKNDDGLTAYEYHNRRNNDDISNAILIHTSAKKIQDNWRTFWFKKTLISPKYFKIKKVLLNDLIYLSPSDCHTFPGGIEYQKAFEEFNYYSQKLNLH